MDHEKTTAFALLPETNKSIDMSAGQVELLSDRTEKNAEAQIASFTPEKINLPSRLKYKKEAVEKSEKFKSISEIFDRMICSLRLLALRKKSPTFQNICTQVKVLVKREFSYRHLAQINYIFPEAIEINKVLAHDLKTLFMKPDLKVTLKLDAVESKHEQSAYVTLCQIFDSRLLSFFLTQPEGSDVPEAILPEPFNDMSQYENSEVLSAAASAESLPSPVKSEPLLVPSHFSPSFPKRISQNFARTNKTQLSASHDIVSSVNQHMVPNEDVDRQIAPETDGLISDVSTTTTAPSHISNYNSSSNASATPVSKLPLDDKGLTVYTPAQLTPKRSMPNCDEKQNTTKSQTQMNCLAKRSLDFSYPEASESMLASNLDELQGSVVHTQTEELTMVSEDHKVHERGFLTFKDHNITGVGPEENKSDSLLDLVPVICHIFKSANFSQITKEELVYKIIINNFDIVDREEVEEQIGLLEKLVPDWFSRNLSPSGDLLYSVQKVSDLDSVWSRLICRAS